MLYCHSFEYQLPYSLTHFHNLQKNCSHSHEKLNTLMGKGFSWTVSFLHYIIRDYNANYSKNFVLTGERSHFSNSGKWMGFKVSLLYLLLIFIRFSGLARFSAYTVIYIDGPIIIIELKLSGTCQVACLVRKRGLHSPGEPHKLAYICFFITECVKSHTSTS